MKKVSKKALSAILSLVMLVTVFPLVTVSASAEEPVKNVIKLDSDTMKYDSIYDESIQVPCPSRDGIYFLNEDILIFLSLTDYKSEQVYDFADSEYYTYDTYCTGDKLYVLQVSFNSGSNQTRVIVYNLLEQEVEKTLSTSKFAVAIGVDSEGRIYLADSNSESYCNIYLFSDTMSLLSETTSTQRINDFGAFDSTNGNFYIDGYYNWLYWGYEHDMHALRVGNVKNNEITFNDIPIFLISQEYWYDRQSPMSILGDRYLCCESTFESVLWVLDSNEIDSSTEDFSDIGELYVSREQNSDDREASIGPRAVYLDKTDTIVAYLNDTTLAEFEPETGKVIGKSEPAYPVFSLMNYNGEIIAIEKSGEDFYLEIFNWERATSVNITGANTVKIGESTQLAASTNGTITEEFEWSSSDPKVASVSADGKVFGWSKGTATISVTTASGIEGEFTVTVEDESLVKNPSTNSIVTSGANSDNVSANNYNIWSSVVNSYLVQNPDGTLTRVEFVGDQVLIETYSEDGTKLISTKEISPELPLFGGFLSGNNSNFLVFGQSNTEESTAKEVLRIVKYSKNWEKQGEASVNGANTYIPFDAGSLRMTEAGEKLYVYTCHEMFASEDGLHHQSNMTFVMNENNMEIVDQYYDVMNIQQAGYVSHSFNQFIQTDGNKIYRVDHGDAYPRAISITSCSVDGSIENVNYILPVTISGNFGNNNTGASVGGFELSETNCIIAANSVDYSESNVDLNGKRNVFVSITDKNFSKEPKTVWLTKYDEDSKVTVNTPQLVKIGDDQFLVAWEEYNGETGKTQTQLVTIDDRGNLTSDIVSTFFRLSDCQPIQCRDKTVRWYVTNNGAPTFYVINPFDLEQLKKHGNIDEDSELGNVNGDEEIDATDATLVLQYYAQIITDATPNFDSVAADVNSDGYINSTDATLILQYFAGIITSF